jgi:Fe-S-cluster containining protein
MTRHSLLVLNPLAQAAASEGAAEIAAVAEAQTGKTISCTKGCGACCRQMVAISTVEAVGLADLVAAMPAERQTAVRERFDAAVRKLEEAGLLDAAAPKGARSFSAPLHLPADQAIRAVAKVYYGLGVACPFLEDESCSIHADRPTICREYQVITPAEWCSRVYDEEVQGLMAAANEVAGLPSLLVPLVLSLEWAERLGPDVRRECDAEKLTRAFAAALDALRNQGERARLPDARPTEATANIEVGIAGRRIGFEVTVPTGPATARSVLPLGRALADVAARIAVDDAAKAGSPVSCKAGCGACCRHLVPLSEPEAFDLADMVRAMPEPRRAAVLEKFAEARSRLADLWPALLGAGETTEAEMAALKRAYFALKVPCPFLADESCSIYDARPLVCREYMVDTDPVYCTDATPGKVNAVSLPVISPFRSYATAAHQGASDKVGWVPLVAALEWAEGRYEPTPSRTGPEWLRVVFAQMTGATPPPAGEDR